MQCRPIHFFSYEATCELVKKLGEPCEERLDICEAGTTCKQGVCMGC
jgi:hypothetical protein